MTTPLTPSTEADLAEAVATAAAKATRLRITGGGTRAALGQAIETDAILSTSALTGIALYEPGSLNMVVRAGTPLAEVTAALDAENQQLAFEPMDHRALLGSTGTPTVGGMVAAAISGPRRTLVGACRDHLLGVRFVNGRGEVLKNGGRVMKNVTGLDLAKLMCGAYGTLGVLTELSLKTLPRAETARTLAFENLTVAQATALFCTALGTPYEISGAAYISGTAYLRLEGFVVQVNNRSTQLQALFKAHENSVIEGAAHAALWSDIRDVTVLSGRAGSLWRLSVKPTDAARIVTQMNTTLQAEAALDWGGGLIWLAVPESHPNPATQIRKTLAEYGGHATLIRGDTTLRRTAPVFQPQSPALAKITAGLCAKFDPQNILNPGLMG
jgi:glycolate dehydrogenase FAD-binding subunit